ncbi:MAG: hypothetical protein LBT09_13135 [Planctomycetaceae bacterium]|nr:hypothetical protein [Planctomycetaceae bacterium]
MISICRLHNTRESCSFPPKMFHRFTANVASTRSESATPDVGKFNRKNLMEITNESNYKDLETLYANQ